MKILLIILVFIALAKMWSQHTAIIELHRYYKEPYNPTLKRGLLAVVSIVAFLICTRVLDISWLWALVALLILDVLKTVFDGVRKWSNNGLVPITISEWPLWLSLICSVIITAILYFVYS